MLIDYLKQTCGETRFLVKEPEEITLTIEQEKNFIRNQNESEGNLMLLAFLNGKYSKDAYFHTCREKRSCIQVRTNTTTV